MNQSKSFVRKVIYIALVGGLLIPLSLVSRPATRDDKNAIRDAGGVLSSLRDDYELSQARLSEIDPGSETMKLASLGLRGVAVNILWMQALEAQEKKQWDTFSSTLNSLVKIQPNFIKVWEFQGHNLSYNTSVEFDDYEQRYAWVKKGIEFLTKGIPYNRRDHRIIDSLGFFSGNKFGNADERVQYRRLFRNDTPFLDEMSKFVNINNVNNCDYGPDHWLLAYEWYDRSVRMVESGIDGTGPVERRRKEMLFYNYRPAQLRNMAMSLQSEFRSDEYLASLWDRANQEWVEFGNRPLTVFTGIEVTMENLLRSAAAVQSLRDRLDVIVPGERNRLLGQKISTLTDEQRLLLGRPVDSLTDEEFESLQVVQKILYGDELGIDQQIASQAPPEKQKETEELFKKLAEESVKMQTADHFRSTVNYEHWKMQSEVEHTEKGIAARQAEFDALVLRDRAIFDEYEQRDPITGEVNTLPGSIQKFDEAFTIWSEIMEEEPKLQLGPMFDDIVTSINKYMVVRSVAGEVPWPSDFILQDIIDTRHKDSQTSDDLPLSSDVAEREASRNKDGRYRMPKRPDIEFVLEAESVPEDDDQ